MTPDQIARVVHEANRALQWVQHDPSPSSSWDQESDFQRKSVVEGVTKALDGYSPEELHQSWVDFRIADGWTHGPVKSEQNKTHPSLVPYDDLPENHKIKDDLFAAIVNALA